MRRSIVLLAVATLLAACGGSSSDPETSPTATAAPGVRVVSPEEGHRLATEDPDVVVLDIRTPEEFAEGHVADAVLIDFYEPDFADRIAELDPDGRYVLYCRSGNRSSQARDLMDDLGFSDVADIDGGIVSWATAGLPVTTG